MEMKKRAGIKAVAAQAGVSPTTVSRVLGNTGYPVSDALRQRVLQAAKDLDYTPNLLGRMLKNNQSRELGIIIPTIVNPFYTQIVLGMETEARRQGFGVMLCNTLRDEELENSHLKSLFEKCIMGVALASVATDHESLRALQRMGLRVVVIDQEITEVEACGKVRFDYLRAGMLAAERLIATGHRRTAYLSSPLVRRSRTELLQGFAMGHALQGRTLPREYILIDHRESESVDGVYELECARRLTERLLSMDTPPDGLYVTNDMIAIGVMAALSERGIRVPEDVSMIGTDNIAFSAMVSPGLTTIEQPSFEMGRLACRMLTDMLGEEERDPLSVTLEPSLVERGSVMNRL